MTVTPTQQSFESSTPKPKRRWLQFNLRTLLVLTLVVGSGLGWVAYERRKNARLQADIAALGSIGCVVVSTPDLAFRPSFFNWLLGRTDFGFVSNVGFCNKPISDAGLVHLEGLTQLEGLDLGNTEVTDAGLVHLKGLTNLKNLNLFNTAITDAGLEHLKGLTNLSKLDFRYTAITDAGLEHLLDLTQLTNLELGKNRITDAGLVHLKGLTQLEWLNLRGTKVTKGGVAELEKSLPHCRILDDAKN